MSHLPAIQPCQQAVSGVVTMDVRISAGTWSSAFVDLLTGHRQAGFLLSFPEYRPDLAHALAGELGFGFFDFRAEVLARLGWDAHTLALDDLNDVLRRHSTETGVVAFNVEALLAIKDEQARRRWLNGFVNDDWPNPVLVPLTLYSSEAPRHPRHYEFDSDDLPNQSFVNRLVH